MTSDDMAKIVALLIGLLVLILIVCAPGCNGNGENGGEAPEIPVEDLLAMLPVTMETGGFVSPTCPHGYGGSLSGDEDDDELEWPPDPDDLQKAAIAHQVAMQATRMAVTSPTLSPFTASQRQKIREWAAGSGGAAILANVAQSACCPVSKGLLAAGGWQIHERPHPDHTDEDPKHPLYWWTRLDDDRVIGNPPEG